MFRPRVIPVLLLKDGGLVKSVKFSDHKYIGDPINAVKLFNDLMADELVFLDITASKENRTISLDFIRDVGDEANMPFSVGGGIKTIDQIRSITSTGAEKVIINTEAGNNPEFIKQASDEFGTSTIAVCMDVKKKFFGKVSTWIMGGSKSTEYTPVDFARLMEDMGAGELIVQSINNDGMMKGYDIELIKSVADAVSIPVIALGGAGSLNDLKKGYNDGGASALAAGSIFVYQGKNKGVLINYPDKNERFL